MILQSFKLFIYIIFLFFYLHIGSKCRILLLLKILNNAFHISYRNPHHLRTYLTVVGIGLNYRLNLVSTECLFITSFSVQGTYYIGNCNNPLGSYELVPLKSSGIATAVYLLMVPYGNLAHLIIDYALEYVIGNLYMLLHNVHLLRREFARGLKN